MLKNPTRMIESTTDTFVKFLSIIDINLTSIEKLSLAGNAKADLVLESAIADCDEARIERKAKLAKLKADNK